MKQHTRFNRTVYAFPDDFVGGMVKWAVKQSPYAVPDNLEVAAKKFHEVIVKNISFDNHDLAYLPLSDLKEKIEPLLCMVPEIAAWNNRKNERGGNGFCTATTKPDPDDDFIDIGALAGNIMCEFAERADAECWLEHTREENKITLEDIPIMKHEDFEGMMSDKKN